MPQYNCQKIKLLKLMEILRHETDEEHPITTSVCCKKLLDIGITCDPRTLHRDIQLLNEYGYEVMKIFVGHERAYYFADRSFSMPELKILIDAVQAASFITEKKTAELICKIAELGGGNRAAIMKSNIVKFNTRKHSNETVYYIIGSLEEAISKNNQVAFKYFDLDEKGRRVFRKNGENYIVEPLALVFNEDNYYLITYNTKHENTTNYRVDRIDTVEILNEKISEAARSVRKKIARYTNTAFKMFNGKTEKITLRFDNKLTGAVYDKFGEKTKIKRIDENTLQISETVRIAPTFWGWVFQFGGSMRIVAPDSIKEEYEKQVRALL